MNRFRLALELQCEVSVDRLDASHCNHRRGVGLTGGFLPNLDPSANHGALCDVVREERFRAIGEQLFVPLGQAIEQDGEKNGQGDQRVGRSLSEADWRLDKSSRRQSRSRGDVHANPEDGVLDQFALGLS